MNYRRNGRPIIGDSVDATAGLEFLRLLFGSCWWWAAITGVASVLSYLSLPAGVTWTIGHVDRDSRREFHFHVRNGCASGGSSIEAV